MATTFSICDPEGNPYTVNEPSFLQKATASFPPSIVTTMRKSRKREPPATIPDTPCQFSPSHISVLCVICSTHTNPFPQNTVHTERCTLDHTTTYFHVEPYTTVQFHQGCPFSLENRSLQSWHNSFQHKSTFCINLLYLETLCILKFNFLNHSIMNTTTCSARKSSILQLTSRNIHPPI